MYTEKPALAGASLPRLSNDVRLLEAKGVQCGNQEEVWCPVDKPGVWIPPTTAAIDYAEFLIGASDRHSSFLALARWHFEKRALCALLQSDDEGQAFRLLHHTPFSPANRPMQQRIMLVWSEAFKAGRTLAEAIRSIDDDEAWQIRCSEFPLPSITETETATHKMIVQLGKEYSDG